LGAGKANPSAVADERRSARETVLLAAMIECNGVRVPVRVINLSAHGALVHGDVMPEADDEVTFRYGQMAAGGWVAWVRAPLAGISFDEPIRREATRAKPQSGAHMVTRDTRNLDFRRPGFRGNQMSDEEREIVAKWVREQDKSGDA
jgi:hypothetical protein